MFAGDTRTIRLTALAALGVALLYLLSVPIGSLSSLPASDASGATIVRFFSEHRGGVLVALALNGIAWCGLMPAAFAGLRALLGVRGGAAAAVALICAGVEAALIVVALVFGALAAYAAPNVGGELETVLADGLGIATNASAWPTVPCVIALVLAARRGGALPRPLLAFALLVAALHAVAAVSFARSGALSPSGVALAAPPAFAILMASIGVSLLRGTRARALERAPAEAAFPPSAGRS